MVGDSLTYDIEPAAAAGIKPIWFTGNSSENMPDNTKVINNLCELCLQ